MKPRWLSSAAVLIVVGALIGRALYAQGGSTLTAIEVDFERTELVKARDRAPVVVESGSVSLASDGRYRTDRISDGEHTAEIIDNRQRQRITLNYALKQAVVGSTGFVWFPPASRPRPVPNPAAQGPWREESQDSVDLGTRAFGPLTLYGTRHTVLLSGTGRGSGAQRLHTFEAWDYRFSDRRFPPVILELRIETPDDVDERRITQVTTVQVSTSVFEIPSDFGHGEPVR